MFSPAQYIPAGAMVIATGKKLTKAMVRIINSW